LREVYVFADRRDDAVRHDHRSVFDARAGNRHNRRAANRERLRLASLRCGATRNDSRSEERGGSGYH